MPFDINTLVQSYKWTEYDTDKKFGNQLPFIWKCPICQTETTIISSIKAVPHKCSNDKFCPATLVFI